MHINPSTEASNCKHKHTSSLQSASYVTCTILLTTTDAQALCEALAQRITYTPEGNSLTEIFDRSVVISTIIETAHDLGQMSVSHDPPLEDRPTAP